MLNFKNIKKLSLVFSDCDLYELDSSMYDTIKIEGITENVHIVKSDYINYEKSSKACTICINEKGAKLRGGQTDKTLEEKLLKNIGIKLIILTGENDLEEKINMNWNEGKKGINKFQEVYELLGGYIILVLE